MRCDHYNLDIGTHGDLIDVGMANTGDDFLEQDEPLSDEDKEPRHARAQINFQAITQAITQAMRATASEQPDLDVALRPLMAAAGILHGDVAGMAFWGTNGECWPTATSEQRLEMLADWMRTEHWMADLSSDDDLQDQKLCSDRNAK